MSEITMFGNCTDCVPSIQVKGVNIVVLYANIFNGLYGPPSTATLTPSTPDPRDVCPAVTNGRGFIWGQSGGGQLRYVTATFQTAIQTQNPTPPFFTQNTVGISVNHDTGVITITSGNLTNTPYATIHDAVFGMMDSLQHPGSYDFPGTWMTATRDSTDPSDVLKAYAATVDLSTYAWGETHIITIDMTGTLIQDCSYSASGFPHVANSFYSGGTTTCLDGNDAVFSIPRMTFEHENGIVDTNCLSTTDISHNAAFATSFGYCIGVYSNPTAYLTSKLSIKSLGYNVGIVRMDPTVSDCVNGSVVLNIPACGSCSNNDTIEIDLDPASETTKCFSVVALYQLSTDCGKFFCSNVAGSCSTSNTTNENGLTSCDAY